MLTYGRQIARYMDGLRMRVRSLHIQKDAQKACYLFTMIPESICIRPTWYVQRGRSRVKFHIGDINVSHLSKPELNVRMAGFEYGV